MRRASTVAAVTVLAVIVSITGCASEPADTDWVPRQADAASVSFTAGAEAPAPTDVTGLEARAVYGTAGSAAVSARWAAIPGNAALNGMLDDAVRAAVTELAGRSGAAFVPGAAEWVPGSAVQEVSTGCTAGSADRPVDELIAERSAGTGSGEPTLTIACEIVAAGGTVIGERLRIVSSAGGAVTADTSTTYYAETSGAFVVTPGVLLTDDGLRALLRSVVESLKIERGAFEPAMQDEVDDFPLDGLRQSFADVSFAPGGVMRVRLPEDFSTPELDRLGGARRDGKRQDAALVEVPAALASGMLTEQGRAVQDAIGSGAPPALPPAPYRGDETVDCSLFTCVALTFDDGPGQYTAGVLDALNARRAAATFFLQGVYIGRYPDLVRRMQAEGHGIGNHTWDHADLTKLTPEEITREITRTSAALTSITGERVTMFRPPYGAIDAKVSAAAGLPAILWSVDTNDWQQPPDEVLVQRAVGNASRGSIILCHDIHENTARTVPAILDGLISRGFTLVTVDQLLATSPPRPGATVKRAG